MKFLSIKSFTSKTPFQFSGVLWPWSLISLKLKASASLFNRNTLFVEKKIKSCKPKIIQRGSEEEGHVSKLIKLRFDLRNQFISFYHNLIRFIILYRSLKYPKFFNQV